MRLRISTTAVVAVVLATLVVSTCKRPDTEETVVNSRTKLPEQDPNFAGIEIRGDTLLLTYASGAAVPSFSPGDVVVGQTGEGYIKKVKASWAVYSNTKALLTEQAALTDALDKCDIDTTFPPRPVQ